MEFEFNTKSSAKSDIVTACQFRAVNHTVQVTDQHKPQWSLEKTILFRFYSYASFSF